MNELNEVVISDTIRIYNCDNMDLMAKYPDNYFDLAIACHDYGFELTGCELDEEYYKKGIERVKNHVSQQKLF